MARQLVEHVLRALGSLGVIGWVSACSSSADPGALRHVEAAEKPCEVTLAAFDVGSATTKMQVAIVDTCLHRIVRELERAAAPVPYGNDVATDGEVTEATLALGIAAMGSLLQKAERHRPTQRLAVATEALRRADNGAMILATLAAKTGVSVRFVSQVEEAALGFWAASMRVPVPAARAVVWDVGGESMQFSASVDGHVKVLGSTYASGDMRRDLASFIQHKAADASPNPVSSEQAAAARAHAHHVLGTVPQWLRTRLADPTTTFVGIGALPHYGDRAGSFGHCSQTGLEALLDESLGRTDDEIGGPYAPGRVSDIALFLGVMDTLQVTNLMVVDVDLTDGLLVSSIRPDP